MKNSLIIYVANIINIGLSFIVTSLLTNVLETAEYGNYKFIIQFFAFTAPLFYFGYVDVIGRRIAINDGKYKYEYINIGLLSILTSTIISIIVIVVFSYTIYDIVYENNLRNYVIALSPLVLMYPLKDMSTRIFMSNENINELSIIKVLPKAILLGIVYLAFITEFDITGISYTLIFLLTTIGVFAVLMIREMVFRIPDVKNILRVVFDIKSYGIDLYVSYIYNTGTNIAVGLMLATFVNSSVLGFFYLAKSLCRPFQIIPKSIGMAYYRRLASQNFDKKKIFLIPALITVICIVFFYLFIKKIFVLVFPAEYLQAVTISYILVWQASIYGFGDLLNYMLVLQAEGARIKNSTKIIGITNILLSLVLMYFFDVYGAAIAITVTSVMYFSLMLYIYNLTKTN